MTQSIRNFAAAFAVLVGLAAVAAVTAAPAHAIELEAALNQGLVGEKPDGYLGTVESSPSAEVQALVKKVNDWRRDQYLDLANKHNQEISEVERVAGQKRMDSAPSGTYIYQGGQWMKKP